MLPVSPTASNIGTNPEYILMLGNIQILHYNHLDKDMAMTISIQSNDPVFLKETFGNPDTQGLDSKRAESWDAEQRKNKESRERLSHVKSRVECVCVCLCL